VDRGPEMLLQMRGCDKNCKVFENFFKIFKYFTNITFMFKIKYYKF